jgi:hypothetical protein
MSDKKKPVFTEKQLSAPLTLRHVEALMEGIAPEIKAYVETAVWPLKRSLGSMESIVQTAVAPLKQRIESLEAMLRGEEKITKTIRTRRDANGQLVADVYESEGTAIKYRGIWNADNQYNEGDFVTDKGSMWCCLASTRLRPGSNQDWQLAVKRGRDAKGA